MAGLLDQPWDIDPAQLSLMAASADPNAAAPAATMADTTPPIAAPTDTGRGFWGNLADIGGNVGTVLGGGLDPSIQGDARNLAGARALLNFGLTALMNSGPSYTPRNFGQILASGLSAASAANQYTEEQRVKAQQIGAALQLKAGQQRIQELLAGITGAKAAKELGVAKKVSDAAAGGDPTPAGVVSPGAAPASAADFVASNAALFQDVAQRTGLPVEFVAGQAANESGWGTSPAAVQGNNLFGVSDPATGKPASYASKQEAVDAYVALLNSRYANVPRTGTPAEIAGNLGKAGYNTVVPDYGTRIGNFAAQAAPLLPRPTTTGPTAAATPGTMVAGPGAGTGAPGGAAAPAPSSTPASPGAGVVGPADATPPATVDAPAATTTPRVTLDPPDFTDLNTRHKAVEATYAAERANVANSGDPTLQSKANQDRLNSHAAIDKERADRQAAWAKENAELQAKQNEAQARTAATLSTNKATIEGERARQESAQKHAVELANINAEQTRLTNKEHTVNQANLDGLKQAQKEQSDARDVVTQLEGFRALSDGVGQPGWLQTTVIPGTGNATIAERLGQMGAKLDDTGGVQLLRAGINGIVKSLRQGMAMGTLSDRDLDFIARMGPTEWMDKDTRTAAVGYLQQAYQAKMRFASDVQKEMSRGLNYGDALDAADKIQKPFVPAVPRDITEHWADTAPEWQQRRIDWAQANGVRPGTLFHLYNGRPQVMKAPPVAGQR